MGVASAIASATGGVRLLVRVVPRARVAGLGRSRRAAGCCTRRPVDGATNAELSPTSSKDGRRIALRDRQQPLDEHLARARLIPVTGQGCRKRAPHYERRTRALRRRLRKTETFCPRGRTCEQAGSACARSPQARTSASRKPGPRAPSSSRLTAPRSRHTPAPDPYNLKPIDDLAEVGLSVAGGHVFHAAFEPQSNIWLAERRQVRER